MSVCEIVNFVCLKEREGRKSNDDVRERLCEMLGVIAKETGR